MRVSRRFREMIYSCKGWGHILLISLFYVGSLYVCCCRMKSENVFSDICREDMFLMLDGEPYKFVAPLFFLAFLTWIVRDVWKMQRIIREKSKKMIWSKGVLKMGMAGTVFTLGMVVTGLVGWWIFRDYPWNWDQKRSAFWMQTAGEKPKAMEFETGEILLWFFLINVLFYMILGVIFWIFYVLIRRMVFAMIVPLACHITFPLARRWSIQWGVWVNPGVLERKLLEELVLFILLVAAGFLFIRRQEFINET